MPTQSAEPPNLIFDLTREKDGLFPLIPLRFEGGAVIGWLSLQGSETHYSTPRAKFKRLLDYRTVELCLTLEPGLTLADLRGHLADELYHSLERGGDIIGYASLETAGQVYQAVLAAQESKTAPAP